MPGVTTNIIITMAGNGDRFRKAGYTLPKFKIAVRGRTLFTWALLSLRHFLEAGAEVIFAARPEHDPEAFLAREAAALGIGRRRVVLIPQATDGQAGVGNREAPSRSFAFRRRAAGVSRGRRRMARSKSWRRSAASRRTPPWASTGFVPSNCTGNATASTSPGLPNAPGRRRRSATSPPCTTR